MKWGSSQLLACDAKSSVLTYLVRGACRPVAYAPYGFAPGVVGPGFNGEWHELVIQAYFLGKGYRVFTPCLMRFLSPDKRSPFQHGGINAYAYCQGNPISYLDPSGEGIVSWMRHKLRRSDPLPSQLQVGRAVALLVGEMAGLAGFHPQVLKQRAEVRQFQADNYRINVSRWEVISWRQSISDSAASMQRIITSWFVAGLVVGQRERQARLVADIAQDYSRLEVINDDLALRIAAIRNEQRRPALTVEDQMPHVEPPR